MELSPATRFDVVQLFTIDSVRLMFTGGGRAVLAIAAARREQLPAATSTNSPAAGATALPPTNAYQYKIEVSTDGNTYTTVLDQSTNAVVRNTIFEEIPPTKCRFVRLTMINWPRTTPLGDHRVHGLRQTGGIIAGGSADSGITLIIPGYRLRVIIRPRSRFYWKLIQSRSTSLSSL